MLGTTVLDDMGDDQVLTFVDTCARTVQDAEIGLLRGARQWAIMHSQDRLDADEAGRPGREKARRYGGAGTPEVMEFAAAELGARIGRSTFYAAQLMADALDLERHPVLKARVEASSVSASAGILDQNRPRGLETPGLLIATRCVQEPDERSQSAYRRGQRAGLAEFVLKDL